MATSVDADIIVAKSEAVDFIKRCFEAVGLSPAHSVPIAEQLVDADCKGHYSHGISKLEEYFGLVSQGVLVSHGHPQIVAEKAATAMVDGNNLPGVVVGNYCMDLAIEKAKQCGIGWVVAKRCNHFGMAGHYSMRAQEQGFIGFAFCNTELPIMVPPRSNVGFLGTNPLSCAAPGNNGDSFVLDMATTTVASGKIKLAQQKGEQIPTGWGLDTEGKPCTDPATILNNLTMCPLGGAEETGGYKGYGLAMMVEILCGVMSGSESESNEHQWGDNKRGQCFAAIDPSAFTPFFKDRMSSLLDQARKRPQVGDKPVLVAGDPEKQHMEMCDKIGGIPYKPSQIKRANDMASGIGVEPLTVV